MAETLASPGTPAETATGHDAATATTTEHSYSHGAAMILQSILNGDASPSIQVTQDSPRHLHLETTAEVESILERQIGKAVLDGLDDVPMTMLDCLSSGKPKPSQVVQKKAVQQKKQESSPEQHAPLMVLSDTAAASESPSSDTSTSRSSVRSTSESSAPLPRSSNGSPPLPRSSSGRTIVPKNKSEIEVISKKKPAPKKKKKKTVAKKRKSSTKASPPSKPPPTDSYAAALYEKVSWKSSDKVYKKLGLTDVLAGRGNAVYSHPGNQNFRDLVNARKHEYVLAMRTNKMYIALEIIQAVQEQKGRFLERDSDSPYVEYREIDFDKAMEKTAQALREGATEIRAKNRTNQK